MTYTLTRSRRKTLAIHIKPDGTIEVRAPLRLAKSAIERFVTSKAGWIATKQAQISARKSAEQQELPPTQYAEGEFEQAVRELVKIWEQRLGTTTTFVGIRRMSTRWGSCTAKTRRIRLNSALELGSVPADLIGAFSLIFYNTPQEAVFKALGVE